MMDRTNEFTELSDFQEGRVLLFDKPLEWTSFDVVAKVRGILRRALNVKKLKVGHAGTLDPLATGLLIICTGKMTKRIQYLMDEQKGYTGSLRFGATTPSYDRETEVNATFPIEHITPEMVERTAESFQPAYMQTAPAFSAKKIGGKPAYLSARQGKDVVIAPRPVLIDRFAITHIELPEAEFDVECSKGTYIRSLVHDLGKKLDSGAHLTSLRRYKSGELHVDQAMDIQTFEARVRSIS